MGVACVETEDAKAMYKSEDRQKRSFQFMDCWKQLRGQAKWMAKLDELAGKTSNKKQKKPPIRVCLHLRSLLQMDMKLLL